MKLSIIVVNWNTKKLTCETIESVFKEKIGFDYEIILVDNSSSDGSVEEFKKRFPNINLILNEDNLGFSKANNQGMKIAKGEYIMLLNSDTVVLDKALNKMVIFLDNHPEFAMVGPRLLNTDGTFQLACRRNLPNPLNSFFYLFGLGKFFKKKFDYKRSFDNPDKSGETEAISGAAMMFRRFVYDFTGGLDEDFFMYGEDLDFCKKLFDNGSKIYYLSEAKIIHYGGSSSGKRRTKSLINFYEAMWIYYKKHFYAKHGFLTNFFIFFGIRLKMLLSLFLNFFK